MCSEREERTVCCGRVNVPPNHPDSVALLKQKNKGKALRTNEKALTRVTSNESDGCSCFKYNMIVSARISLFLLRVFRPFVFVYCK